MLFGNSIHTEHAKLAFAHRAVLLTKIVSFSFRCIQGAYDSLLKGRYSSFRILHLMLTLAPSIWSTKFQ